MGFSLSIITTTIKNSIFKSPNHTQTRSDVDEFHPDPSLVLLPPYLTTKSIDRARLPKVEYAIFRSHNREKEEEDGDDDDDDEDSKCAVCLSRIEAWNDVRELGNCEHAFHVECLDPWMDAGRDTCPICRAPVAAGDGGKEEERDPWRSQRMEYLFGEDCLMEEL